ncbi:mate-domain-containing protein [Globomyces pollinis-pini]|nr:mate-domain-containing protein [Globomyces pollinis-pini]KAJ2993424.1 hypothetical protein HDV02_002431 [Globomyces sp. JEL0801]
MAGESTPLLIGSDRLDSSRDEVQDSYLTEAKVLVTRAWPVSAANLLQYSINAASLFSLGHMSTKYLAAAALGTMLCNVTGNGVASGLTSALDTLCSQAFTASDDIHAVGKLLQRGIIVMFIFCIPISLFWSDTKPFFVTLGQDPEISSLAAEFLRCMIPGLFPSFVNECLRKYLQAQGIMKPGMYINIVGLLITIFLQWLLVFSSYSIGFIGAPIATSITYICVTILSVLYIAFIEGNACWGGWSWKEALQIQGCWEIIKLGIPGVFMICSEWGAFEIMGLAAGLLGAEYLASQTIVLNICSLSFNVPLGLSVATSTRVGNKLGANLPQTAKHVAKTAFMCALGTATIHATILVGFRHYLGYVFTSDPVLISIVADVLPLAGLYQFSEHCGAVGGGVIRGCALQRYGAPITLSGYYILGLPFGLYLSFYQGMDLVGVWIGLTFGLMFVSTCYLTIVYRLDWKNQAELAVSRILQDSGLESETTSLISGEEQA